MQGSPGALHELAKSIPHSKLIYPARVIDRVKYWFWHYFTPYHPQVRDTLLRLGIVWHEGRQDFLIGTVAPHTTIEEVITYLVERGFHNHFVAWEDDGELVSLRYPDGFKRQYHLRIFEDGEIRAHYEYTTEAHPIRHMRDIDVEPRREYFLELLGERIIPS
jgi:hypothetical protein